MIAWESCIGGTSFLLLWGTSAYMNEAMVKNKQKLNKHEAMNFFSCY